MNYSRRQFQLVTIAAAVSTAFTAAGSTLEKEVPELRRRAVLKGLNQGINFTDTVSELLTMLQRYSTEQTLLGGCVLSLAADQPSDTVHILVQADPLKVAEALRENKIEGMQSINGNSLAFSYKNQPFFIEHLSKVLYQIRLKDLAPGSKDNDFYIEFAHQLVTYNVQSERFQDPQNAIGNSSKIELRRVSAAANSASVLKTMVESKRLGVAIPRDEQRIIEKTLRNGLTDNENSLSATESFLSQLSQFTQYHEEQDTRRLLSSKLAKDTLGHALEFDINDLNKTYYKIKRKAPRDAAEGDLWLSAIQCLENTEDSQCHETLSILKKRHSGHQLFINSRNSSRSNEILRIKGVKKLHIKQKKRRRY